MRSIRYFLLPSCAIVAIALLASRAAAQSVDTTLWVTNGGVYAVAHSGNTLYVGGSFTRVGPSTGGGVPLSTSSAAPIKPFPKVAGTVYAVVPDRSGGWFVGGRFAGLQGVARSNLAHVLADGSVAAWSPNPDSVVYALALDGSILYVGGSFRTIGGQNRNEIAAVDVTSGNATSWNPSALLAGGYPTIFTLATDGGTVYAGGIFTVIGGQSRTALAALDPATGMATSWDPSPNGYITTLAISGATIYVGGGFSSIGGQPRSNLAAIDASSGMATGWNPNPNAPVYALAPGDTTIYVGGGFTSIGGRSRYRIAALGVTSGAATAWDPHADTFVDALALNGTTLYAGGGFANIGGQARAGVAALDLTAGLATAWHPDGELSVQALALDGSALYVGGTFVMLAGIPRANLAALDLATGMATSWNPNVNGPVRALARGAGVVWIGGGFNSAGGQPRANLAVIDSATGAATLATPGTDGSVNALSLNGSTLYLAGDFNNVGMQSHVEVAAVDAITGALSGWHPTAGYQANDVAAGGSRVYVASQSGPVGTDLVSLDAGTGSTLWGIASNGASTCDAIGASTVYLGGNFTSVSSTTRHYLAAFDSATGNLMAWDPSADGWVYVIEAYGSTIYVGGGFTHVGGQPRRYVAALDATTGASTSWRPDPDGFVYAIDGAGSTVYLGGAFSSTGYFPQSSIAAFPSATLDAPLPPVTRALFLEPCVPNPARSVSRVRYTLARSGRVSLGVFDLQGRRVAAPIENRIQPAGPHEWTLETARLRVGLYVIRLEAGGRVATGKLLVVR